MVQRETVRDSRIRRVDRVIGTILIVLIVGLGAALVCIGTWELAFILAIQ